MKCSTITAARLIEEETQRGGFRGRVAMVTATYRPEALPVKYHMTELLKCIREWLRRRNVTLRYVWVKELTKAGVPHFHLLIWLPRGLTLPFPDKRGWWRHGFTKIEWARNPVGYIAKYTSKGDDGEHEFPKNGRIYGSGGLDPAARRERRWWLTPKYVRQRFPSPDYDPVRAPGGGWVARLTGEFLPSLWIVSFQDGVVTLSRRPALEFQ